MSRPPVASGDHVRQWTGGAWVYGRIDRVSADDVQVWWAGRHWQVVPRRRLVDPHHYANGRLLWGLAP